MARRPWYRPAPTYIAPEEPSEKEPEGYAIVVPAAPPSAPPLGAPAKRGRKPKESMQEAADTPPVLPVEEAGATTKPVRNRRSRIVQYDGPDPIDIHVGNRMKERRVMLGISQATMGGHLRITFQQVQKQEKGRNRISASTLWRIAKALEVPVSYFFDQMDEGTSADAPSRPSSTLGAEPDIRDLRSIGMLLRLPQEVKGPIVALIRAAAEAAGIDEDGSEQAAE
ncbi:Conserved protein of unknown function (lambda repressor-like DNA-binding domains 80-176) (plasmid) [Magnetospirillum sp. XM-1]|uniref:helix-turn-helix domain-containing protein n=1 Tax=Magnetospirillum sp. XM-1 TaxID=1663591 RepID=UPI00073DCFC0|nr:helix-turn-helix transcriptional regulator [Magnetospirillum sp. XM-1]CUW41878.1 Conserved protein of unknown function (lambda repressor-like DNA-binding domains 80-176) [Magnetospirillum sp. XM-1]